VTLADFLSGVLYLGVIFLLVIVLALLSGRAD
jgi:hypothetical protein